MTARNTTDVLRGDLNDNENVKWLYERFIEELDAFVGNRISEEIQRHVDEEGIAETSFRQAVDRLKTDPKYARKSAAFRALLYRIAHCEIANQVRTHKTQSRDITRESQSDSLVEEVVVDSDPLKPDEKVSVREEMREGIKFLLQEEKPVLMIINLLGIVMELPASDIREILKGMPPEGETSEKPRKPPSEPTIRLQLDRTRERIRRMQKGIEATE